MDLERYKEDIQTLFDTNSDVTFDNGRTEHALVIMSEFFKRAESSIVILCRNLKDTVYSDKSITAPMKRALERGVDIKVIVQEDAESKKFIAAANAYNNDFSIEGTVKIIGCGSHSYGKIQQNVAVMDEKALRFEKNKFKHEARASANQPENAARLASSFNNLWNDLVNSGATILA